MNRGVVALALAALMGSVHLLPAQDTLDAGTRLEAPAAAEPRHGGDRIVMARDEVIAPDEVVDGKVVVTGGDLTVRGTVRGNVTVTGGRLRLLPGAVVDGSVQVTGGDFVNAGTVRGDARVLAGRLITERGVVAGEMRVEDGTHSRHGRMSAEGRARMSGRGFMRSFSDGLAGLVSTVAMALLLAGLGAAAVFYAHGRLDRVSDSVRADTLRAGALGVASNFLVLPAYVVGCVVLALSLIGIPVLLVFIPLFPVLVLAAWAVGLVAVAHALGERTAERRGSLDAQYRNSYAYVFTGVAMLLAPLVAANLLKMTVVLRWAGSLLEVLAWMGLMAAATVGLGALFLTRAGNDGPWGWRRRPPYDPIFDGPHGGSTAGV